MVKVQKKISQGMDAIEFFTMNNWHFKSANYIGLVDTQDREEWEMYVEYLIRGFILILRLKFNLWINF